MAAFSLLYTPILRPHKKKINEGINVHAVQAVQTVQIIKKNCLMKMLKN